MMFLFPKKAKFTNSFTGKKLFIKNSSKPYNIINKYGSISLIANECGIVTNFQLEAIRRFLRRFLKKKAQIFFRVFPTNPVTKKPNDIRQGRGKGSVKYWACSIKKGTVLLEISCFDHKLAKSAVIGASTKLAIKTFANNRQLRWIL